MAVSVIKTFEVVNSNLVNRSFILLELSLHLEPVFSSTDDEVAFKFFGAPVIPEEIEKVFGHSLRFFHVVRRECDEVYWFDSHTPTMQTSKEALFMQYFKKYFSSVTEEYQYLERRVFEVTGDDLSMALSDCVLLPEIRREIDDFITRHDIPTDGLHLAVVGSAQ
jgi:hypothetical protein